MAIPAENMYFYVLLSDIITKMIINSLMQIKTYFLSLEYVIYNVITRGTNVCFLS